MKNNWQLGDLNSKPAKHTPLTTEVGSIFDKAGCMSTIKPRQSYMLFLHILIYTVRH